MARRDGTFYQSEPPRSINTSTAVRQEIDRLVALGMLVKVGPEASKRIYYRTTDSNLWSIVKLAGDICRQGEADVAV